MQLDISECEVRLVNLILEQDPFGAVAAAEVCQRDIMCAARVLGAGAEAGVSRARDDMLDVLEEYLEH